MLFPSFDFIPLAQLFQVERLFSAEFHSSVDHFAVGGVGEDFPHTVAAVTRVHQSLLFGDAGVCFGGVSFMKRPDQNRHKPPHTPAAVIAFGHAHDICMRIRNSGRLLFGLLRFWRGLACMVHQLTGDRFGIAAFGQMRPCGGRDSGVIILFQPHQLVGYLHGARRPVGPPFKGSHRPGG